MREKEGVGDLAVIADGIMRQGKVRRQEQRDWNRTNPLGIEVTLNEDDEEITVGIWKIENNLGFRWGTRRSNGYSPHLLQVLDQNIFLVMLELHERSLNAR